MGMPPAEQSDFKPRLQQVLQNWTKVLGMVETLFEPVLHMHVYIYEKFNQVHEWISPKNDDINATTSQHKMLCPYPKKGKKKS